MILINYIFIAIYIFTSVIIKGFAAGHGHYFIVSRMHTTLKTPFLRPFISHPYITTIKGFKAEIEPYRAVKTSYSDALTIQARTQNGRRGLPSIKNYIKILSCHINFMAYPKNQTSKKIGVCVSIFEKPGITELS